MPLDTTSAETALANLTFARATLALRQAELDEAEARLRVAKVDVDVAAAKFQDVLLEMASAAASTRVAVVNSPASSSTDDVEATGTNDASTVRQTVLTYIRTQSGDVTIRQIAEATGLTTSRVYKIMARLHTERQVVRSTVPGDPTLQFRLAE